MAMFLATEFFGTIVMVPTSYLIHCLQFDVNFQIFLYHDDVEVCNPIGSKRVIHKLGM